MSAASPLHRLPRRPPQARTSLRRRVVRSLLWATLGLCGGVALASSWRAAQAAPPPGPPRARWKPPALDDRPGRGPTRASTDVILFVDLACPRSATALPRLAAWADRRSDVRLLVRQRPLDFHPEAAQLAKLALAAHQQGRFWPFAEAIIAQRGGRGGTAALHEVARKAGLDVPRLFKDAEGGTVTIALADDLSEARRLAAADAPTLVVHGTPQVGELPVLVLDELVEHPPRTPGGGREAEVAGADAEGGPGSPPPAPPAGPPAAAPTLAGPRLLPPSPPGSGDVRVRVPAPSSAPALGPAGALVTVVLFSDFQCPFCSRGTRTVHDLQRLYGNRIRIVWQNLPLPFHPEAAPAALAALAAHRQKKFWAYHDRLFATQSQLDDGHYEALARELKLDLRRWNADRASGELRQQLEGDVRRAVRLGILGTPTLFINGRLVRGAQPLVLLRSIVEEELGRARAFLRRGTRPAALYEALIADGEPRIPGAPLPDRD